MSEPPRVHPLLHWGLTFFHTTIFVLVPLVLIYASGNFQITTRETLATSIGLTLFTGLTVTTWWTTGRMLNALSPYKEEGAIHGTSMMGVAIVWGGVNGMLFFLFLVTFGAVIALIATTITQLLPSDIVSRLVGGSIIFLAFVSIGTGFAFIIGALIGLLLGILDSILLLTSGSFLPRLSKTGTGPRSSDDQPRRRRRPGAPARRGARLGDTPDGWRRG